VIIRGGGSAEDLAAFSTEQVTRAVAASRVPTLVAIGHEVDLSLAELAADRRASTPSNAAELLVPDRRETQQQLRTMRAQLTQLAVAQLRAAQRNLSQQADSLQQFIQLQLTKQREQLTASRQLLAVLSPTAILRRGYAIVRQQGTVLHHVAQATVGGIVDIELMDGQMTATVIKKKLQQHGRT
jgi:exodeoxyribonuclease VII large subunit